MTTASARPGCLGAFYKLVFRREPPRWPAAGTKPPKPQWPDGKHPMSEPKVEALPIALPATDEVEPSSSWPSTSEPLPYRVRDAFLSPAEISFYHVLRCVLRDQAVIQTKVGLGDIFYVSRPHENQAARYRISQKHVDFLLCEPKSLNPLAAIELDDSSHARADRKERDAFVNRVFEEAGLPLLRFPVRYAYQTNEVAQRLAPYFGDASVEAVDATRIAPSRKVKAKAPLCPRCGIPMMLRMARRGPKPGEQFYGCRNYPRCWARLPLLDRTQP
jgi:hypothetical protein